ncbi:hypothetical protein MKW92_016353 [Papaver armeniacum]|nr:hypothetical protein MKW92_016353 [Papaver armeniacum]
MLMSFSSSVYLQFTSLSEFVSSHKPPWVTLINIAMGFFLTNVLVNLWICFIISPNKYQAIDEKTELEDEVSEIKWKDRDGWSRKLIEKKNQKIAALEKKIDRLQNWYWVTHFFSMFLSYGSLLIAFQIAMNHIKTSN